MSILGKLIDHKDYSDEKLGNLTWEEKCRVIQSDPVTCSMHFDFQLNNFFQSGVPTRVTSYSYANMAGNAPMFGIDNDEDVACIYWQDNYLR